MSKIKLIVVKTLSLCLDAIAETGITEIAIIVGGVGSNKVREYYGNGEKFGVKITYIEQDTPKGIAHAINLCKNFIGSEKFLVFLGDNIIQKPIIDERYDECEFSVLAERESKHDSPGFENTH